MSNIFGRTIDLKIPRIRIRMNGSYCWDASDMFWFAFWAVVIIAITAFSIAGTFWGVRKIVTPPPKVITKVVYESALTAAQKEYIKQCEQNHQVVDGSASDNNAIPNVEVTPWTCTFAH